MVTHRPDCMGKAVTGGPGRKFGGTATGGAANGPHPPRLLRQIYLAVTHILCAMSWWCPYRRGPYGPLHAMTIRAGMSCVRTRYGTKDLGGTTMRRIMTVLAYDASRFRNEEGRGPGPRASLSHAIDSGVSWHVLFDRSDNGDKRSLPTARWSDSTQPMARSPGVYCIPFAYRLSTACPAGPNGRGPDGPLKAVESVSAINPVRTPEHNRHRKGASHDQDDRFMVFTTIIDFRNMVASVPPRQLRQAPSTAPFHVRVAAPVPGGGVRRLQRMLSMRVTTATHARRGRSLHTFAELPLQQTGLPEGGPPRSPVLPDDWPTPVRTWSRVGPRGVEGRLGGLGCAPADEAKEHPMSESAADIWGHCQACRRWVE